MGPTNTQRGNPAQRLLSPAPTIFFPKLTWLSVCHDWLAGWPVLQSLVLSRSVGGQSSEVLAPRGCLIPKAGTCLVALRYVYDQLHVSSHEQQRDILAERNVADDSRQRRLELRRYRNTLAGYPQQIDQKYMTGVLRYV